MCRLYDFLGHNKSRLAGMMKILIYIGVLVIIAISDLNLTKGTIPVTEFYGCCLADLSLFTGKEWPADVRIAILIGATDRRFSSLDNKRAFYVIQNEKCHKRCCNTWLKTLSKKFDCTLYERPKSGMGSLC
jgi:hypothetical protein